MSRHALRVGPAASAVVAVVAALALAPVASAVNPYVHVSLRQRGSSGVSGSAVVAAKSDGTRVTLTLYNLAPKAVVRAFLHAGTCAKPSASLATIVSTKATAAGGVSTAAQLVLGGKPVSYFDIADGDHLITISAGSRVVACGAVPAMH